MSLINLFSKSLINPLIKVNTYQGVNVRSLKSALKIKWVRPVKKPHIHPSNSGDLQAIPVYDKSRLMLAFQNSKELATADDTVKQIFQLDMNMDVPKFSVYKKELGDKVRRHCFDNRSHEVYIANLTASIRFLQEYVAKKPKDKKKKVKLENLIDKRKKQLTHLRRWDYKRFEWILEKLDLVYRPYPNVYDKITRKTSLTQLVNLHCEELKEKKIAEYRKSMDTQKVPFLEEKLKKLQLVREQEKTYGMTPSVTEEDIFMCQKQLEKVRLDLEDSKGKKYVRTIDPYTLETYDEDALRAAEKKN